MRNRCYLGGEALACIQAQALAVEHRVLDDRDGKLRVLLRLAQPLRERGIFGQHIGELVGDAFGQTGGEQARRDGQDPDPEAAQIASHRQAHTGDRGLGRRVGDLSDLAFEGGDRSGVDDDAALFGLIVHRIVLAHLPSGEPADIEGADQVEVDALAEGVQAVRAFLADGALPFPRPRW